MTTTFIRLLSAQDKAEALTSAVAALRDGRTEEGVVFTVDPSSFSKVPNSPFAYWVDDSIRDLFVKLPPFEGEGRTVRVGLQTSDDFRFVRAWWEVPASRRLDAMNGPDHRKDLPAFQDWCRKRTGKGKYWVPFAKGGEYSPYYADIHLVVNWKQEGEEIKSFADPNTGKAYSRAQNTEFYFRPGITWPLRTTSGFGPYVMPAGGIFAHKGPAVLSPDGVLLQSMAIMLSGAWAILIGSFMAAGDETHSGTASRSYEVGIIQCLPFIGLNKKAISIVSSDLSRTIAEIQLATGDSEPALSYRLHPALAQGSIADGPLEATRELAEIETSLERIHEANLYIWQATGLNDAMIDRYDDLAGLITGSASKIPFEDLERLYRSDVHVAIDASLARTGGDRQDAVKSYNVSRKLEVLCRYYGCGIGELVAEVKRRGLVPADAASERATSTLSLLIGCSFGRWDVRPLLNEKLAAQLPDPFSPLPVCPPATLMGPDGLPATSSNMVSEEWFAARPDGATLPPAGSVKNPTITDNDYPIEVPWDGILVDDPDHPADVVIRMRKAMEVMWKEKADSVEQEACQALGVSDLRAYMRSPGGFFQDHLSRYSKSRRKAPIYWPLSISSGSYTLWLYYPRLTEGTLYQCVNAFVKPKLDGVRAELSALRARMEDKPSAETRDRFDVATSLERELEEMMQELLRVAALGYRPDLDDGVVICACPLRALFRLPRWKDELDEIWEKLERGDFDWAHMAMTLWPDRVKAACAGNRSFAIAHDQEALFVPAPAAASKPARSRKGKK